MLRDTSYRLLVLDTQLFLISHAQTSAFSVYAQNLVVRTETPSGLILEVMYNGLVLLQTNR